jgi:tyrosyl-tRNA synthetase
LVHRGFVQSKSEFIRLIQQDGVQINGEKINLDDLGQVLYNFDVIKIGKKKFLKIIK